MASLRFTATGATDVGLKRRRNEDALLVDADHGVYGVADGMGGHAAGDVASRLALDAARDALVADAARIAELAAAESLEGASGLEALVSRAVRRANRVVHDRAESDPDLAGMGTTIVLALVAGSRVVLGHVGDSRAYLVREGVPHRLTEDHTLVKEQVRKGLLSEEQARTASHGHVLARALGPRASVEVDTVVVDAQPGDAVLLCTDGITRGVSEDALAETLTVDPAPAPYALIALANAHGGVDNASAVVLRAEEQDAAQEALASAQDAADAETAQQARAVDACTDELQPIRPALRARLDDLRKLAPFHDLTDDELLAVLEIARIRDVSMDSVLICESEPTPLLGVLHGRLDVSRHGEHLATLTDGATWGEAGLFGGNDTGAAVCALEASTVVEMSPVELRALIGARPDVGCQVLTALGHTLAQRLDAATQAPHRRPPPDRRAA